MKGINRRMNLHEPKWFGAFYPLNHPGKALLPLQRPRLFVCLPRSPTSSAGRGGGGYVLLTEWNWFNTLWPKPFLNRSVFPKRPQRAFWWPTNRFPCSKFILTQHHHYEGWAAITEQKNCSVFRRTERCSEEQLCVQRNRAVFRRTDQFSEDSSVFRRTALFRRTGLCSEEASHTQKNSSLFRRTGLCWEEQTGVQNNASWTIFFATRRKSMN